MRARFTSATVSSRPRAHQGHLSFAAVVTVGFVGGALDYVYVKLPAGGRSSAATRWRTHMRCSAMPPRASCT